MFHILNFGSINIDYVYKVDHIVRCGETISSNSLTVNGGGKGQNQSIALAKAGVCVYHAGKVGEDGKKLVAYMKEQGVNTSLIDLSGTCTGNAMIQLDRNGENCIILHAGANYEITSAYIQDVLSRFGKDDILVLQNEINRLDEIIDQAYARGIRIAFNPSPVNDAIKKYDLNKITWFFINEIEGYELTGKTKETMILDKMIELYPNCEVILTLGGDGVRYARKTVRLSHDIYKVAVVDTTAAGDTFTGYFLSGIARGKSIEDTLALASKAASITVSRMGAAVSIPYLHEVEQSIE